MVVDLIASRFARREALGNASALMQGMIAGLEKKNCWTIAEHRGHASPHALQHLLGRAKWDADEVRDDLRSYVTAHLGEAGAVLILDETGDLKKGTHSVGVQRQYTGTAGRIENAQVAVYMTYATSRGHALIDRALYLPKAWTQDRGRCAKAGIPDEVEFNTKPGLGADMITRAVTAGVSAAWVAGDEVYGADPKLRKVIRGHKLGYVMQIASNRKVTTTTASGPETMAALAKRLPEHAWQVYSAGAGSKGPRYYSWAWVDLIPEATAGEEGTLGCHSALIRRNDTTGELAFHLCWSPRRATLAQLIKVAGTRWRIEESFQTAKGLVGLDQHQVRRWTSWNRWTTLAMLAHAFLAILTAAERDHTPTPPGLITLTVAEVRRLFNALALNVTTRSTENLLAWSYWRRRHQQHARQCHYKRRPKP